MQRAATPCGWGWELKAGRPMVHVWVAGKLCDPIVLHTDHIWALISLYKTLYKLICLLTYFNFAPVLIIHDRGRAFISQSPVLLKTVPSPYFHYLGCATSGGAVTASDSNVHLYWLFFTQQTRYWYCKLQVIRQLPNLFIGTPIICNFSFVVDRLGAFF